MGVKVIQEPQLYCEDSIGNFVCILKEGDNAEIKLKDGSIHDIKIHNIDDNCIDVENEDFEQYEILIEEICDIKES